MCSLFSSLSVQHYNLPRKKKEVISYLIHWTEIHKSLANTNKTACRCMLKLYFTKYNQVPDQRTQVVISCLLTDWVHFQSSILSIKSRYVDPIREVTELHPCNMNREDGFCLVSHRNLSVTS
jgi:hypothetical protein